MAKPKASAHSPKSAKTAAAAKKLSDGVKAARRDTDGTKRAELASALKAQMPGWRLSSDRPAEVVDAKRVVRTSQGVTLDALKRKFLSGKSVSDNLVRKAAAKKRTAKTSGKVTVFKVEPAEGGPSQVADMRGGKVKIVSG